MIDSYYIFDDIIDSVEQDKIESHILGDGIKWLVHENITGEFGGGSNESFPGSVIYWNTVDSDILSIINKIEKLSIDKIQLQFVKNLRSKINKTSPLDVSYDTSKLMHIDMGGNHIVIIYYINDSDGDTVLFTNKNGNSAESIKDNFNSINIDNFKLLKRVSPKKGRVLIFNGNLYHYGEYPNEGNRFVINYNTVAKNKILKNLI
jgi:hypothetical protein